MLTCRRFIDGVAQLQVGFRVAAAVAGRNDDGEAQLAEQLTRLASMAPFCA